MKYYSNNINMDITITNDLRLELFEAIAKRTNTPGDVKDVSPQGRPSQKGTKKPGAGIPKGVKVFDSERNLVGEWDSVGLAGEAMNTPYHRIKVACQKGTHFFDMNRTEYFAEYFELPKVAKTKEEDNY